MQSGSQISGPSNEIQVFVDVPVAPSPPENLVALVDGSTVATNACGTSAATPSETVTLRAVRRHDPRPLRHQLPRRGAIGLDEPTYRELARQIRGGTRRLELTIH